MIFEQWRVLWPNVLCPLVKTASVKSCGFFFFFCSTRLVATHSRRINSCRHAAFTFHPPPCHGHSGLRFFHGNPLPAGTPGPWLPRARPFFSVFFFKVYPSRSSHDMKKESLTPPPPHDAFRFCQPFLHVRGAMRVNKTLRRHPQLQDFRHVMAIEKKTPARCQTRPSLFAV